MYFANMMSHKLWSAYGSSLYQPDTHLRPGALEMFTKASPQTCQPDSTTSINAALLVTGIA
ncbi:unnamed protein product, partial [Nesidiocoris tenuis]